MSAKVEEFDLQPAPRILPMLGEITLAQWRCVAELIDNAVDGFLQAKRAGHSVVDPQVHVQIPTLDTPSAHLSVRDNGPGMAPETLALAVKAGWSGNNAIDSLGMFGMGFNIATARLGSRTTVWTYTEHDQERHGLVIDFDELLRNRTFRTRHLTQPKPDPLQHGTEIRIENLKLEQRAWLCKNANISRIKRELSMAYSAMLRADGSPLSFKLFVNNMQVAPHNHCTWSPDRGVETTRHGFVPAVITIDRKLADRSFCNDCWQWLHSSDQGLCPACGKASGVVRRIRHVHGWVGLQRYLSSADFGIDFIRNGRKIEIANKDIFIWTGDDGSEVEYPIDDPRNRGRFVGEIHVDHCRVNYTKDRFDRNDPAWEETIRILRGDGPLRPDKAAEAGFGHNEAPLFRLFQAYRRTSPGNMKLAGGWKKVLVVQENSRAEEMARKYQDGDPVHLTDQKWWDLVEDQDNQLLLGGGGATKGGGSTQPSTAGAGGGGLFKGKGAKPTTPPGPTSGSTSTPAPPPVRNEMKSLSREYRHEATSLRWDVHAYAVKSNDSGLGGPEKPWRLTRNNAGVYEFLANIDHPAYRSATLTELDALLWQLAESAVDSRRQTTPLDFPTVVAELRERYAGTLRLEPDVLSRAAIERLNEIAGAWRSGSIDAKDYEALFDEMPQRARETMGTIMAVAGVTNQRNVVSDGGFLMHASPAIVVDFFVRYPHLFLDGRCWDDPYESLDFKDATALDEARRRTVKRIEAMMLDVAWLAEQPSSVLGTASRERLLRAALAIDLIAPNH